MKDSLNRKGSRWSNVHAFLMLGFLGVALFCATAWPICLGGGTSLLVFWLFGRLDSDQTQRFSLPNWITGSRVFLVCALGLFPLGGPRSALLAGLIFALDGLDGWLARRLGVSSLFGARFDMETDAFLVLVAGFAIYQAEHLGGWILLLGLMRYIYVLLIASGRFEATPGPRYGRQIFSFVACSLMISLWPLESISQPVALLATMLLTYSFALSLRRRSV